MSEHPGGDDYNWATEVLARVPLKRKVELVKPFLNMPVESLHTGDIDAILMMNLQHHEIRQLWREVQAGPDRRATRKRRRTKGNVRCGG